MRAYIWAWIHDSMHICKSGLGADLGTVVATGELWVGHQGSWYRILPANTTTTNH